MYLDSCYIVKFYLQEPDSSAVRALVRERRGGYSSAWALGEFHAVLHRQIREGRISRGVAREYSLKFSDQIESGFWKLAPVTGPLLRRTGALLLSAPPDLFLRAGDAVHLETASELGLAEVWSSDKHFLAAASYFGLKGRSVSPGPTPEPA